MAKGVKGSSPPEESKPVRTSFIIDPTVMKKIRVISIMDERDITDLVNEGLGEVIKKYEKKNGEIVLK